MKKLFLLLTMALCLSIFLTCVHSHIAHAEDWGALIGSLSDLADLIDEEESSEEAVEDSNTKGYSGPLVEVEVVGQTLTVHQDFIDAMNQYEAFFDEYCEFMKDSENADIAQYVQFLESYTEYMKALESVDEYDLTDDELIYYLDVMNQINMKMMIASK